MKQCNICKQEKPYSEFYINKAMKDGHLNRCISCSKDLANKKYECIKADPILKEKEQKRHRDKYHRLGYAEKHKKDADARRYIDKKYRDKFPEKEDARKSLYAIKRRREGYQYHHWSYNEQHVLDVIELTNKNHYKAHRFIVYDQERRMYRRFDTNELLDTRKKHEKFIKDCIKNKED